MTVNHDIDAPDSPLLPGVARANDGKVCGKEGNASAVDMLAGSVARQTLRAHAFCFLSSRQHVSQYPKYR